MDGLLANGCLFCILIGPLSLTVHFMYFYRPLLRHWNVHFYPIGPSIFPRDRPLSPQPFDISPGNRSLTFKITIFMQMNHWNDPFFKSKRIGPFHLPTITNGPQLRCKLKSNCPEIHSNHKRTIIKDRNDVWATLRAFAIDYSRQWPMRSPDISINT